MKKIAIIISTISILFGIFTLQSVFADSINSLPEGIRYTIPDEYDSYILSHATKKEPIYDGKGFAGTLSITGDLVEDGEKNGVKAYYVQSGDVTFTFTINEKFLTQIKKEGWETSSDLATKIDKVVVVPSDKMFGEGIIDIQVSGDSTKWASYEHQGSIFWRLRENGQKEKSFTSTPMQLNNGCFYRIVFAYELKREKTEKKFLGGKYDYINYAEVYELYLFNEEATHNIDNVNTQQYRLGTKIKTGDNFFGNQVIDSKDKHYGWDLGYFFITGFTEHQEINGNHVFLKNVGDEITLWFNMQQNIDSLNGSSKLQIKSDTNITDQFFELPKTDFGRGALIIRYTDYQNIQHEPVIYTNFLEASTFPFANTKVELFEEGDYEIALDYSIDKNHYRIAFNYSIRNSNCMIYPFDVVTKSEMVNSSYTDDGFYLDLARSRYLDIVVKRVVMANGVEDVRFNRSARDGEQYTDEGIYIITVKNKVTGEQTEKRIYVGADYKQYSQN